MVALFPKENQKLFVISCVTLIQIIVDVEEDVLLTCKQSLQSRVQVAGAYIGGAPSMTQKSDP